MTPDRTANGRSTMRSPRRSSARWTGCAEKAL